MKLDKLIKGLNLKVYGQVRDKNILDLCNDSRVASPGSLFIAKRGKYADGNDFIQEAVDNGAVGIISEHYNPFYTHIVQLVTPNIEEITSLLSIRLYENPSELLYVIGITGTNGKTTVSFIVKHILDKMGYFCGLLGTISYIIGDYVFDSNLTTPFGITTQKMMRKMIDQGCKAVSMEVSSIGLMQERTKYVDFNAAIFTNLTLDHLDFHHTLESYFLSKKKLFDNLSALSLAVINRDSEWGEKIIKNCSAKVITYGLSEDADVWGSDISLSLEETSFVVHTKENSRKIKMPLIGRHNVYNVLAAIAVIHYGLGISLIDLSRILESVPTPKGRLEMVSGGHCKIFVDYAHSPDALENVLLLLREILPIEGKIIIVFGCGGDRDVGKRALMAKVAEKYGFSIVTTDNCRTEDPLKIMQDIAKGFCTENYRLEQDRKTAIRNAIEMAKKDDIVLIAGKGHENYQLFAHTTVSFNDYEIASDLISNKFVC